jgi:hypothetical protein
MKELEYNAILGSRDVVDIFYNIATLVQTT